MPELSEEMVRYLTEIDHHDHEAVIALAEETGEGIGIARYVRNPERPDAAEVAVTVIDDWRKGRRHAAARGAQHAAREEDITSFTALMLAANQEMMDVLSLGPVRILDRELGRSRSRCRSRRSGWRRPSGSCFASPRATTWLCRSRVARARGA